MSTRTKSPLHPSALSINDLRTGRRIIEFNCEFGIYGEFIVVKEPYVAKNPYREGAQLKVDVRSIVHGGLSSHFLVDMGIIPTYGGTDTIGASWNPVNFTIDAKKRALLPESIRPKDSLYSYGHVEELIWGEIEEEEEEE